MQPGPRAKTMQRLSSIDQVPDAARPGYTPSACKVGIVHLGPGAFHKAHQAALTDAVLAIRGGDWRILGISLRSQQAVQELSPQNGLYTLIAKGAGGTRARVIGAISGAICSADDPGPALAAMAAPATRIVSLTVTEKAYGLDRYTRGCDPTHPAIAADLANPGHPQGVLGLLTAALARRRDAGLPPFTVLCCDNLPENGALLRGAVVDFSARLDQALATWIRTNVAFPSTMVDRITPAPTDSTRAQAASLISAHDLAATETEDFCQWVIEDNFTMGRPDWNLAGAVFVDDVAPYEKMKLRMLNGSHSMLAYVGFHTGCTYVRDAMADPAIANLVQRHLTTAAATLGRVDGIDYPEYAAALLSRFENPAIAHETFQIAMDGSEKMEQRIFSAVPEARKVGVDIRPFAFTTAAWLRHVSGATHDCAPYELRDPRAAQLTELFHDRQGSEIIASLHDTELIPANLRDDLEFWLTVQTILVEMLTMPMRAVVAKEVA